MKRALVAITVLIFMVTLSVSALLADDHSEKEVRELVKKVEKNLDKYNEAGADKFAGKELSTIEQYVKKAKAFLDEGDTDEAFYEVGKADAYFKLIDAKKDLIAVENEYKGMKK